MEVKTKLVMIICLFVLLIAAMACVDGGGGGGGLDATATFGAEQFHLQLTAVGE
jgi:hypothetical protein